LTFKTSTDIIIQKEVIVIKKNVEMNKGAKKQIVIHDDFSNLLDSTPGAEDPANLAKAANRLALSGADIISICAGQLELVNYHPAQVGEVWGANGEGQDRCDIIMRALTAAGVDPFGVVVDALRKGGCTVLAKFRMNDSHHLRTCPQIASQFWRRNPEWRIGNIEAKSGRKISFNSSPAVGPTMQRPLSEARPLLLDYAVAEVREFRLAVVREVMERCNVDGLTLNFIRQPFCISFPSKNAPLLTRFVAECRTIVDEAVKKRGNSFPILGAIVPWDLDYCRVMGLEVEKWVRDGLLNYVSPTPEYVTKFDMVIEPWMNLASSTRCAVYPGMTGLTSLNNDVCLPEEYEPQERWVGQEITKPPGTSKVTHENVRALAHGFYAEGADGISFFNFYSACYQHLYPLPNICLPERIEGKERRYIYMHNISLYGEFRTFLQLVLRPGCSVRKVVKCRLHENLKKLDACVRFKALHIAELSRLRVDINNQEVPPEGLSLIPHGGEGFLYAQFWLKNGILREGANEIGFSFRDGCTAAEREVIIQEVEIRVLPF
jgi:hypothetical protein